MLPKISVGHHSAPKICFWLVSAPQPQKGWEPLRLTLSRSASYKFKQFLNKQQMNFERMVFRKKDLSRFKIFSIGYIKSEAIFVMLCCQIFWVSLILDFSSSRTKNIATKAWLLTGSRVANFAGSLMVFASVIVVGLPDYLVTFKIVLSGGRMICTWIVNDPGCVHPNRFLCWF